ncbi:ATP synthase subunit s-like protein, partial [Asbolus verrucosus]
LWYLHNVEALKITSLDVPKSAWDAVKLNCKYDLEGETLYGVKWYKDQSEFFRCLADGTVQEFPLKDIKIYHTGSSQTGSCFFELTALTSKSGGEYMCEVSLDRPTFQTVTKTAHLQIIEPSKISNDELSKTPESTPCSTNNAPTESLEKYDPKNVTKADMKWRTPWHQKEGHHYSTLRSFYSEDNQTNLLKLLQTPIDLSPSAIKKWWAKKQEYKEIVLQSYLPERNQILGNELAAAHFIVHRGGAVKFYTQDKWIKANENQEYKLPRFYEEDKILQAIDCSNMNLYYEGLLNLRDLKKVEWLSFNGVEQFDDWCLDRISNLFSHSLIYLDIRNCPNYTERGLGALYKMENLKILCIDDLLMTTSFEMTCLMLQEVNPHLDIQIGE